MQRAGTSSSAPARRVSVNDEHIQKILQEIADHPNANFSKLAKEFEANRNLTNLVQLLEGYADKPLLIENWSISLSYYLNRFSEVVNNEPKLNETSVGMYHAARIYSRKVDSLNSAVHQMILDLNSACGDGNQTTKKAKLPSDAPEDENILPAENNPAKPKKPRKSRTVAKTPFEADLTIKPIKKLPLEKRYDLTEKDEMTLPKRHFDNWTAYKKYRETNRSTLQETGDFLHPAMRVHATVTNPLNPSDTYNKRSFLLYTRYTDPRDNRPLPGIPFGKLYQIKDYLEEEQESQQTPTRRNWSGLTEDFFKEFIALEDRVLRPSRVATRLKSTFEASDSGIGSIVTDVSGESNVTDELTNSKSMQNTLDESAAADESIALEESASASQFNILSNNILSSTLLDESSREIVDTSLVEMATSDIPTHSTNDATASREDTDASEPTEVTESAKGDSATEQSGTTQQDDPMELDITDTTRDVTENSALESSEVTESAKEDSSIRQNEDDPMELDISINTSRDVTTDAAGSVAVTECLKEDSVVEQSGLAIGDDAMEESPDDIIDLTKVTVNLHKRSSLYSELCPLDKQMLNPRVVMTDVLPNLPSDVVVKIEPEENEDWLDMPMDVDIDAMSEAFSEPFLGFGSEDEVQLVLPKTIIAKLPIEFSPNIDMSGFKNSWKIQEKFFKKSSYFKLRVYDDFKAMIQEKTKRKPAVEKPPRVPREFKPPFIRISITPDRASDFLGFPPVDQNTQGFNIDKARLTSHDSGVSDVHRLSLGFALTSDDEHIEDARSASRCTDVNRLSLGHALTSDDEPIEDARSASRCNDNDVSIDPVPVDENATTCNEESFKAGTDSLSLDVIAEQTPLNVTDKSIGLDTLEPIETSVKFEVPAEEAPQVDEGCEVVAEGIANDEANDNWFARSLDEGENELENMDENENSSSNNKIRCVNEHFDIVELKQHIVETFKSPNREVTLADVLSQRDYCRDLIPYALAGTMLVSDQILWQRIKQNGLGKVALWHEVVWGVKNINLFMEILKDKSQIRLKIPPTLAPPPLPAITDGSHPPTPTGKRKIPEADVGPLKKSKKR